MKLYSLQGKLYPKPPFDFSKSLNFVSMFTPTGGEQTITQSSFIKAVYLDDQTLAFKLINNGSIEKPVLSYMIYSKDELNEEIKNNLLNKIKF